MFSFDYYLLIRQFLCDMLINWLFDPSTNGKSSSISFWLAIGRRIVILVCLQPLDILAATPGLLHGCRPLAVWHLWLKFRRLFRLWRNRFICKVVLPSFLLIGYNFAAVCLNSWLDHNLFTILSLLWRLFRKFDGRRFCGHNLVREPFGPSILSFFRIRLLIRIA